MSRDFMYIKRVKNIFDHFSFCNFAFAAMDYFNDFWYGYITAEFVRRCVDESLTSCHGCRGGKISPLLHMHHQRGLKDKLIHHMESVRGALIPLIPTLYEDFKLKVTDANMDKDAYVTNARFFLISVTPESLYYGRYLTESNDSFIHYQPITEPAKPAIKRKRKQKKLISHNVVGGGVEQNSEEELF